MAVVGRDGRTLADAWADTTTPHGKLMLTILGGLAEFERSLILTRTGEGRARAMARGVKFGRQHKLTLISNKRLSDGVMQGKACQRSAGCSG